MENTNFTLNIFHNITVLTDKINTVLVSIKDNDSHAHAFLVVAVAAHSAFT